MAAFARFQRALRPVFLPRISRRFVSTSKKNNETAAVVTDAAKCETKKEPKNWVSYGFDYKHKEWDRNAMHSSFFAAVTLCIVVLGFYFMYLPDYNLRDWAQREAFLELRRRENAGLPLIDKNIVDESKIVLPSDEELGDTEIII